VPSRFGDHSVLSRSGGQLPMAIPDQRLHDDRVSDHCPCHLIPLPLSDDGNYRSVW
jgi:hypothetical protein